MTTRGPKIGDRLQSYAQGDAEGCQHPIKDVVDLPDSTPHCNACNTTLRFRLVRNGVGTYSETNPRVTGKLDYRLYEWNTAACEYVQIGGVQ